MCLDRGTHRLAPPGVGDIEVLITRIKATAKRYGILQTGAGGPGAAGYWVPSSSKRPSLTSLRTTTSSGWTRVGTVSSTALECGGTDVLDKLDALDGLDRTSANTDRFLRLAKAEADQCAKDPLTPYIDTEQTARDIDLVRSLLGESKTSWLGYSAGTWLGAWYATQFPSR